jgi:hypothetical protein
MPLKKPMSKNTENGKNRKRNLRKTSGTVGSEICFIPISKKLKSASKKSLRTKMT